MKDCTTCKYGYKDEQFGIPMCHHPKRFSEDCVDFNMHEEKETKESEKPTQEGLEEEIAGMYQALFGTDVINRKEMLYLDTFEAIARHFAQWGAEHLKK